MHKNRAYQKVTILNLFTIVNGTAEKIKNYIGIKEELKRRVENDVEILRILSTYNPEKDIVIAAWGANNPLPVRKYDKRIKEVLKIMES